MEHKLEALEESFTEDGIVAVCSCGWRSNRQETIEMARAAHVDHTRATGVLLSEQTLADRWG